MKKKEFVIMIISIVIFSLIGILWQADRTREWKRGFDYGWKSAAEAQKDGSIVLSVPNPVNHKPLNIVYKRIIQ